MNHLYRYFCLSLLLFSSTVLQLQSKSVNFKKSVQKSNTYLSQKNNLLDTHNDTNLDKSSTKSCCQSNIKNLDNLAIKNCLSAGCINVKNNQIIQGNLEVRGTITSNSTPPTPSTTSVLGFFYNCIGGLVNRDQPVPFYNTTAVTNLTFNPGETSISFSEPGIYYANYIADAAENPSGDYDFQGPDLERNGGAFALYLNGTKVPGSSQGLVYNRNFVSGQAVFMVTTAGQTLELRALTCLNLTCPIIQYKCEDNFVDGGCGSNYLLNPIQCNDPNGCGDVCCATTVTNPCDDPGIATAASLFIQKIADLPQA